MGFKIIGVGGVVPGDPISNQDLSNIVLDSDPQWVESRTGILNRHFADKTTNSSDLALLASREAIKNAAISASDIDLIIVCTTSPDSSFPSVATKLQGKLGCKNIPSFDVQAVCAGFVYGIEVSNNFILSGKYQNILLVGVDKMSNFLDMKDRSTAVLFGDGAGAVILSKSDIEYPICEIYSDGKFGDILFSDSENDKIQMNGREVYRHAVEKMSSSILSILNKSGLTIDDVKYIVPHQANERIIDSIGQKISAPAEKVVKTISKYANNSAATIPLALWDLKKSQNIRGGDLVLITALGAGIAWGSALVQF